MPGQVAWELQVKVPKLAQVEVKTRTGECMLWNACGGAPGQGGQGQVL